MKKRIFLKKVKKDIGKENFKKFPILASGFYFIFKYNYKKFIKKYKK